MVNPLKRRLLKGEPVFGTWIQLGHSSIAEILANAGFDWIAVDCEHSDITSSELSNLFRAMKGHQVVPMVRVRENDTLAIRQALDLGAMGVIVPLVNTPEQALKAVAAAKFPPMGIRGFSFSRCNMYGADFQNYAKTADDETTVVVMIESRQAVQNIRGILGVQGVDGAFIGPYDLSGSYGVTDQTSHPDVLEAGSAVVEACAQVRKAAGIHVVIPDELSIRTALKKGFTFIALGMDDIFLESGAKRALHLAQRILQSTKLGS